MTVKELEIGKFYLVGINKEKLLFKVVKFAMIEELWRERYKGYFPSRTIIFNETCSKWVVLKIFDELPKEFMI